MLKSKVVEMGRSLRSCHGHGLAAASDSTKLMIKCEGSWKESSVRGKMCVFVCVRDSVSVCVYMWGVLMVKLFSNYLFNP